MKSPLIIDRPDLQAWQQKAMFGALTAMFWMVWVFLWMPLITLLAWLFFGQRFQLHIFELDGYKSFMGLLAVYCLVICAMGGGLLLWATYNYRRFRGVDRRRNAVVPSTSALGDFIQHPSTAIDAWRSYSIMTVDHDDHGGITKVTPVFIVRALNTFQAGAGGGKTPSPKAVSRPATSAIGQPSCAHS